MREAPEYRDTLMRLKEVAGREAPGKAVLNVTEIARVLGCSRATVYNRGMSGCNTVEKLARALCH